LAVLRLFCEVLADFCLKFIDECTLSEFSSTIFSRVPSE
jgi:hypothetical protein